MKNCLLLLCFSLLFWACPDDDNPMGPEDDQIEFDGVSLTDANGSPIGSLDPTDWRTDVSFNEDEQSLFPIDFNDLICIPSPNTTILPVFPNPAGNTVSMLIDSDAGYRLELRLVDRNYQILLQPDDLNFAAGTNQFQLDFSSLSVNNDTLRLYYILDYGTCASQGFGDIIIQQ